MSLRGAVATLQPLAGTKPWDCFVGRQDLLAMTIILHPSLVDKVIVQWYTIFT